MSDERTGGALGTAIVEIKKGRKFDAAVKTIQEWPDRMMTVNRQLAVGIGKEFKRVVFNRIVAKNWWQRQYKASIQLGYLSSDSAEGVVVFADEPGYVRTLDASKMLIFFRPESAKGMEAKADFFRKYQPWTVDALPPVAGNQYGAKPYVKLTTPRIVMKRRQQLKRLAREIKTGSKNLKIKAMTRGTPRFPKGVAFDLPFSVLSMEFGRGGRPAWRQALRQDRALLKVAMLKFARRGGWDLMYNPMTKWDGLNVGYSGLKPVPPSNMKSIYRFQNKITFGRAPLGVV